MYLDEKNEWKAPERPRHGRGLTDREERLILWLVGVNVVAMLIAPIGGASIIQALFAMIGG